jgi:hypothetical protein
VSSGCWLEEIAAERADIAADLTGARAGWYFMKTMMC